MAATKNKVTKLICINTLFVTSAAFKLLLFLFLHSRPLWRTNIILNEKVFFKCYYKSSVWIKWLTHTLLFRTLCSPEHFVDSYFALQNILLLNTFCSQEHFALQHSAPCNTLLHRILCFSAHFAFCNNLLLGTLRSPGTHCSLVTFPPQDTLHPGALKARCSRK